jgi:RNA polymerase sigma-70 factor (ECF subfamily)
MTDGELILQLASGDAHVLDEIFARYGGYVAAVVFNTTGSAISQEDRDEVVADVFVSLWKNAAEIDIDRPLKPWLAVVARNAAINKSRGVRELNVPLEFPFVDSRPSPHAEYEAVESSSILRKTLNSFDRIDQEIFHRFYFWCQTTATISQDLGMNESTVRSKLSRGREKLKLELAREGYVI